MTPSEPSDAFQPEYIIGAIFLLLLLLVISAFCVFAIVQAFRKRTTGWIIAGSLGGVFLALPVLGFTVAFLSGVMAGLRERTGNGDGEFSESAASSDDKIQGQHVPYTFRVPSSWHVKRNVNDFDALASFGTLYVGVIAEEGNIGDPNIIADIAREHLKGVASEIRLTRPEPFQLDGRDWLQFTADCRVQKIPFSYRFYVYAGKEGTFQIIGWTLQDSFEQKQALMREVMDTFRFPESSAASAASIQ